MTPGRRSPIGGSELPCRKTDVFGPEWMPGFTTRAAPTTSPLSSEGRGKAWAATTPARVTSLDSMSAGATLMPPVLMVSLIR